MYIDNQGQSKIQLGGFDTAKYARTPMKFYKISNPMFWQLKMHDVMVGGQPF